MGLGVVPRSTINRQPPKMGAPIKAFGPAAPTPAPSGGVGQGNTPLIVPSHSTSSVDTVFAALPPTPAGLKSGLPTSGSARPGGGNRSGPVGKI